MLCADFKWPSLLSCRQCCLPSARLSNSRRPSDINSTPALPDQASLAYRHHFPCLRLLLLCASSCGAVTQNLEHFSIVYSSSDTSVPTGRGGRHSPPASSAGPGNSWSQDEFVDKCSRMVDQVRHSLGPSAPIFDRPVDGRLVPDYYNVIKKPMDLGTLKQRLHEGYYSTPQQFAEVSKSSCLPGLGCVQTFCYSVCLSLTAATASFAVAALLCCIVSTLSMYCGGH